MIEFADKKDIPKLSAMWQEIFSEDKEICKLFFKDIFPISEPVVYRVGGQIASALFLLPCSFGNFRGFSVYCAMTKKEFRGKGYMKELLDFSYNSAKEKQLDFLFLVPAEESLFGYYEKCGFVPFGGKQVYKLSEKSEIIEAVHRCSENEYIKVRKVPEKSLAYPDKIISYWVKACIHYNGEAVICERSRALIFPGDNEVILRDVYGDENGIRELAEYAQRQYPDREITAEGKIGFAGAQTVPCGMVRTDNEQLLKNNYYIGITLE